MELPANVKMHPAAFVEADDAYEWYANADPRIANRFRDEIRAAATRIGEHPERYPLYPESSRVRWIKLRKFPYLLIYEVVGDSVHIVAVAHGRRRPYYWRRRLT